jgi:FdhD protein
MQPSVTSVNIQKVQTGKVTEVSDLLAAEVPLEVRIIYGRDEKRISKNIAVTMRTPGNDFELAAGFLLTEGIIKSYDDILYIKDCTDSENVIKVYIKEHAAVDLRNADRNFYTTSSCGICGKTSIDAVKCMVERVPFDSAYSYDLIASLPEKLRTGQNVFEYTGGLHAAALFNNTGDLVLLREDVGRHNAVDKLIGAAAALHLLPLHKYLLLLSGRAGFELVQKAAVAGAGIVAAVGAPTSLAVEMASESGITLIGFLRNERFNIYTYPQRILTEQEL